MSEPATSPIPASRRGARALLACLVLFVVAPAAFAQGSPAIESIAGGGPRDVPAVSAALFPEDIAVDSAGNIYFTSRFRHRISRVDPSGILRVVAGTGIELGLGDGGPVDRASFLLPEVIALTPAGDLIVYGGGDHYGCCSPDFSIWNRTDLSVRRIGFVSGTVEQVISFRGSILWPSDLVVAPDGTLVVANYYDYGVGGSYDAQVLAVDPLSGIWSFITGGFNNGGGGPLNDGQPAIDSRFTGIDSLALGPSQDLFLTDRDHIRIRFIDEATGIIDSYAPAMGLYGNLDFDGDGNLHVQRRATVRKIDAATGAITVVAGTGTAGHSGDGGPATSAEIDARRLDIDSAGALYLAESNAIRRVDPVTGIIETVAGNPSADCFGDGGVPGQATIRHPTDITMDPAGNLYIAEAGWTAVRKIDARTGEISSLFRGAYGDTGPTGLSPEQLRAVAWHDRALYYSTISRPIDFVPRNRDRVYRYEPATGMETRIAGVDFPGCAGEGGPADQASLDGPEDLAFDSAGNLFIADADNHQVRRVDGATGVITRYAGITGPTYCRTTGGYNGDHKLATDTQLQRPTGLAFDPDGNLHIADYWNHRVRRVDAATGKVTTVAGTGEEGFSGDGGPATQARIARPYRIAFDAAGDLYIAGDERIRKVDAVSGVITTLAGDGVLGFHGDGGPAAIAGLGDPRGMTFDAAGNLLFAAYGPGRIRRIDLQGGQGPLASADPSLLWPPNHALWEVHVTVNSAGLPAPVSVVLAAVVSSEDDDAPGGSDGTTADDIQDAEIGTADFDLLLRAERAGSGPGRVYAITYLLTDGDGITTTATAYVTVPHDMGGVVDPVSLSIEETSSGTLISWEGIPGANSTSVIRGEIAALADLPDLIDLGDVVCVESRSRDASTLGDEDPEIPDPGRAWFYLGEYRDPHPSTYGSVFADKPREPLSGACN